MEMISIEDNRQIIEILINYIEEYMMQILALNN